MLVSFDQPEPFRKVLVLTHAHFVSSADLVLFFRQECAIILTRLILLPFAHLTKLKDTQGEQEGRVGKVNGVRQVR